MLIRAPRESEAKACRMLLPEAALDPQGRAFRLAVRTGEGAGQIAGAISWRDDGASLVGLRVHAVRTRRREGVATRLVDHALEQARTLGRAKLVGSADVHTELDAEAFLFARGFTRTSRLTIVDSKPSTVAGIWDRYRAKTEASEPLPPGARFVGIDQAPMAELVALYAEHIAHIPVRPGLSRTLNLGRFRDSVVLMIDGKIAGAMLAEYKDGVFHVPAWIVIPEYRGRYVGNRLGLALGERLKEPIANQPVRRVRFEYLDIAPATAKAAEKAQYDVSHVIARFEKAVDPAQSETKNSVDG